MIAVVAHRTYGTASEAVTGVIAVTPVTASGGALKLEYVPLPGASCCIGQPLDWCTIYHGGVQAISRLLDQPTGSSNHC